MTTKNTEKATTTTHPKPRFKMDQKVMVRLLPGSDDWRPGTITEVCDNLGHGFTYEVRLDGATTSNRYGELFTKLPGQGKPKAATKPAATTKPVTKPAAKVKPNGDATPAKAATKPAATTKPVDKTAGKVTVSDLAKETGIAAKVIRRNIRKLGLRAQDGEYAFDPKSDDLVKVREALQPKKAA